MKKITPKQYATSLYESIKDTHGDELTKRIRNFLLLLKKRKDLKLLNKIFKAFVSIFQEQEGLIDADIISCYQLSDKVRKEIISWLEEQTKRDVHLKENIDQLLLGGVIIKYEDTVIDGSLKNRLNKLKEVLSR